MLTHWCQPPDATLWPQVDRPGTLGARVDVLTAATQTTERYTVALLGTCAAADAVRRALYACADHFPTLHLLDLGNLRRSEPSFATPLLGELLDARVIPVWLGDTAPLLPAAARAYQLTERTVRYGCLRPDLDPAALAATGTCYAALGYQAHRTLPAHLAALRAAHDVELLRLGALRPELAVAEPLLRNLDLLGVHAGVIREADLPAQQHPGGAGLSLEEACQLAHYAGMSDRLSALVLDGWEARRDADGRSARALATLVWYFLDGVAHRTGDFPISKLNMTEYIVSMGEEAGDLTFWKSERSGRWWVEVTDAQQPARRHLLACSHTDYEQLTRGELTPYLLRSLHRFA